MNIILVAFRVVSSGHEYADLITGMIEDHVHDKLHITLLELRYKVVYIR